MSIRRRTSVVAIFVAVGFATIMTGRSEVTVMTAEDPHAYFNSLIRRTDYWKSYSLRDSVEINAYRVGKVAEGSSPGVSYDPANDTNAHRQDAAKVTIPAFYATAQLTEPVSATSSILTLDMANKSLFPANRVIKIDREIMTVTTWLSDRTVSVARGTLGTQPASHAIGATVMHATNSLRNQVRLPLGTEDGHDYFFVWDSYWTDSFVNAGRFNHKAFQFTSGGREGDTIWLEPDASYADARRCPDQTRYVTAFHMRYLNTPGGDANWWLTNGDMLGPGAGPSADFCILPNTWVRFFLHLRQRANDYDIVDMWVADETRDAVQVVTNTLVSVRPTGLTPNSIAKFWIEFNSSEDELLRLDGRELVAYVRNFVALRDATNPNSLLIRPASDLGVR